MSATDGLTDTVQINLGQVTTVTAEQFLGRLGTVSAYLLLAPEERARALRRVRAVLPDRLDIDATVRLTMARRI